MGMIGNLFPFLFLIPAAFWCIRLPWHLGMLYCSSLIDHQVLFTLKDYRYRILVMTYCNCRKYYQNYEKAKPQFQPGMVMELLHKSPSLPQSCFFYSCSWIVGSKWILGVSILIFNIGWFLVEALIIYRHWPIRSHCQPWTIPKKGIAKFICQN